MYRLVSKIKKSTIFYVLLFLVIILTPSVIYQTAESDRRAVTIAIGIDQSEDSENINLDLLILTPQSSNDINKNETLVSSNGNNVTECINKIQQRLGKEIGLSHCQIIVLSNNVASDNPMKYLDTFTRTNNLTTNTLIACSSDPHELLSTQVTDSSKSGITLSNILNKNKESMFVSDINLEKFYSQYFDESSISYIPIINVKTSQTTSASSSSSEQKSSSNQSSGNASSANEQSGNAQDFSQQSGSDSTISSSGESESEINYEGEVALFSKGKMIAKLTKDDVDIFNILAPNVKKTTISLENITTNYVSDANFNISVIEKQNSVGYSFVNGYPVVKYDVTLVCKVAEINANKYYLDSVTSINNEISANLKEKMQEKILNQFASTINYAKENDIDMFYLRKYFYRLCTKEWQQYNINLNSEHSFMQNVIFLLNINIIDQS